MTERAFLFKELLRQEPFLSKKELKIPKKSGEMAPNAPKDHKNEKMPNLNYSPSE